MDQPQRTPITLLSKRDYQGVNLTTPHTLTTDITAIVGRNGAGKSRLFRGLAEGDVVAILHGEEIPRTSLALLSLSDLKPSLAIGFDPPRYREDVRAVQRCYERVKRHLQSTIPASFWSLNKNAPGEALLHKAVYIAHYASEVLKKDVRSLHIGDIADFYRFGSPSSLGALNITETFLSYRLRQEDNEYHDFRNHKYAEDNPVYTSEQFAQRFGPPPWETLNHVLSNILGGQYYIDPPPRNTHEAYEANLKRKADDKTINVNSLSSGENVLMWLCLVTYTLSSGISNAPPPLLMLDEPDGTLHPQMVQKLHLVLEDISSRFNTQILFTTHSPTTVALFRSGDILRMTESQLSPVEKDAAIAELLVGLDQVSITYSESKPVYVESHLDQRFYSIVFQQLRRWRMGISEHSNLTFIPAAPKLPEINVRNILTSALGDLHEDTLNGLLSALNGQGDCERVLGAVESLASGGAKVAGLIDWDLKNKSKGTVEVLGENIFYSLENAALNPATLGIYLLSHHQNKLLSNLGNYGLDHDFDIYEVSTDIANWQSIADGVTRMVIGGVKHDMHCSFANGFTLAMDTSYMHMNGHALEEKIKLAYPFLRQFNSRAPLVLEIAERGFNGARGRTIPRALIDALSNIQRL